MVFTYVEGNINLKYPWKDLSFKKICKALANSLIDIYIDETIFLNPIHFGIWFKKKKKKKKQ